MHTSRKSLLALFALVALVGCTAPSAKHAEENYLITVVAQAFWFSKQSPATTYPTGISDADTVLCDLSPDMQRRIITCAIDRLHALQP